MPANLSKLRKQIREACGALSSCHLTSELCRRCHSRTPVTPVGPVNPVIPINQVNTVNPTNLQCFCSHDSRVSPRPKSCCLVSNLPIFNGHPLVRVSYYFSQSLSKASYFRIQIYEVNHQKGPQTCNSNINLLHY
jgi:hypothetical protein